MEEGTKLEALKREIWVWLQSLMTKPITTILVALIVIVSIGLASGLAGVAPRIANDIYSHFFPPPPPHPFSDAQTIYSNIIPVETDIIDLDHAGTLTPSPYNKIFISSSEGICKSNGAPLVVYSQGIVLVLNAAVTLGNYKDIPKPAREITFLPPPSSNYFIFKAGTTNQITTNGRTFLVTLSHINDLSTVKNGPYFSYVFNINEK